MAIAELLIDQEKLAVVELLVDQEELAVTELLIDQEELPVAELLIDQEEWQVHGPQMMRSVFDLTVHAASMGISSHLRKFYAGSTI
jgi:hypothetical protein